MNPDTKAGTMHQKPEGLHGSQLAFIQQLMVVATLFTAMFVMLGWWERSVWLALVLGGAVLMGFSLVLALEFALAVRQHGNDPTPKVRFLPLVRAWWEETRVAATVFSWRQPFLWRRVPDVLPARRDMDRFMSEKRPVVFVHGFVCNRGFWHPWMRALARRGIPYVSMNLEPVVSGIDDYVEQLEAAMIRVESAVRIKPVVICHSMGGLVARAWMVAASENSQRIERLITIGTPHQGTWLARWSHTTSGKQMRIGSAWLENLKQKEAVLHAEEKVRGVICWYSNTDNIVFPPSMATLAWADNRLVPDVGHVALAFHPSVVGETMALLMEEAGGSCESDERSHVKRAR